MLRSLQICVQDAEDDPPEEHRGYGDEEVADILKTVQELKNMA
jgi:hypothetical protein